MLNPLGPGHLFRSNVRPTDIAAGIVEGPWTQGGRQNRTFVTPVVHYARTTDGVAVYDEVGHPAAARARSPLARARGAGAASPSSSMKKSGAGGGAAGPNISPWVRDLGWAGETGKLEEGDEEDEDDEDDEVKAAVPDDVTTVISGMLSPPRCVSPEASLANLAQTDADVANRLVAAAALARADRRRFDRMWPHRSQRLPTSKQGLETYKRTGGGANTRVPSKTFIWPGHTSVEDAVSTVGRREGPNFVRGGEPRWRRVTRGASWASLPACVNDRGPVVAPRALEDNRRRGLDLATESMRRATTASAGGGRYGGAFRPCTSVGPGTTSLLGRPTARPQGRLLTAYAIRDILQSSPEVRDRLTTNRSAPFLSADRGALPTGPGGITPTSRQLRKRAAREARAAKRAAEKEAQAAAVSHVFARMRQHLADKLARVLDLFRAMDDNGDGHIQPEELGPALAQLGFEATEDDLKLAHVVCEEDVIPFLPSSFCVRSLICLLSRCVALG